MKKKIFSLASVAFAFFCLLVASPALAASSALAPADLLQPDNLVAVGGIAIAVLELVLRLKPTDRDYSLITKLLQVLNLLVPNRAKTPAGPGIFKLVNFKKKL